jgi:voltage-gated potassium channel
LARSSQTNPYQIFMLGLCIYVLAALAAQTFFKLDDQTIIILDTADYAICVVFLIDFIRSLIKAESRVKYFITWGWLDLISSIPAVGWLRIGRAARLFRIIRVLRGMRAAKILATFAFEKRAESTFWATLMIAILVTIFGSIAILHLETHQESNIHSAADAMWWSFVTITTVGYGDHFPVTPSGRVLAAILMLTGIGLFGTFTAYVASAFLSTNDDNEIAEIRDEVRKLRELIERTASEN